MANSGIIIVTELRKLVDGLQTKDVKPNLKGDKDYIPPYQDTSKCALNSNPVATTTTSAPATPTTTIFSYKSFSLSDQSYSDNPYACNHSGGFDLAYHNGSNTYPVVGDEVYSDSVGNSSKSDGVYLLDTSVDTIRITQGTVSQKSSCTAPPPVTTTTAAPAADYSCGDGYEQQSTSNTSYGFYPPVTVSSSDPTSNTFFWEAMDRPNRFNVYENGSLVDTSGWVGNANYVGPWGSSLNTQSTGSFQFNWTSGSTNREVRVEFGGSDPNNQVGDGATWQITC